MTTLPLSKSEFAEKYVGILQPLEVSVTSFYRQNAAMCDHDILHVNEALLKYVKAKLTNYPLPEPKLQGVLLGLYQIQLTFLEAKATAYSFKEIQECLKMLEKSIKLWNRELGSRGYLNFISQYT